MRDQTSNLLLVLLIAAALAAVIGYAHLARKRDEAERASVDLQVVRQDLHDLARAGTTTGATGAGAVGAEMTARISAAASSAGVSGQLSGIEPSRPGRVEGSDYNETVVFVHFQPLTLRQVASFLDELAAADPGARPKTIELAPPPQAQDDSAAAAGAGGELWSPDVTLSYLTYAPAGGEGTR
jgi:hypothetical protein